MYISGVALRGETGNLHQYYY